MLRCSKNNAVRMLFLYRQVITCVVKECSSVDLSKMQFESRGCWDGRKDQNCRIALSFRVCCSSLHRGVYRVMMTMVMMMIWE